MDKYIGSMLGGRYQIEEIVGVGEIGRAHV